MAEGKSLKFQFVLDEQSFARVKRALGELTTEASKFAKAMQGSGGGMFGGANVGRPPSATQTQGRGGQNQQRTTIGSAILGDIDAFQKLSKSGKAGMDAMTQAVRTGVREQMREIEKLEGKMASLNKVYAKDPRAAYMGSAFTQNLQSHMLSTQGQISAAQGRLTNLQGLQGILPPGAPGWGGAPVAPAGGAAPPGGVAGMVAGMGGMAGIAAMAAKIAGLALAGGTAILKTSVSADQFGLNQDAMRGGALAPAIARMKRGDISDQMALRNLQGRSQQEQMEILRGVVGTDAIALSKLSAGMGLVNPFGKNAGDINQALEGTFGGSQQTTEMIEQRQATLDAVKKTAAFQLGEQRYLDFAESSRGDRIQSSRIAGLGLYRQRETRKPGLIPYGQYGRDLPLDEKRKQQYFDYLKQNEMQGIADSAVMAGYVESRHQVGDARFGRQFALNAASGWGGFNAVQGAAGRMGDARLARMALGGGINTAAGIQLGQGVLGAGFDPRGTVNMAGVFGAFQGGYGGLMGGDKAGHFNMANQALAGLGVGDSLTGGTTSGWQQGMNILSAIRANPTGDAYTTDYLATGMSFKQMLAGAAGPKGLTETAKASGITSSMLKAQLGGVAEGALSMWVDTGANDSRSRAMRRWKSSGQGINEFMKTSTDEDAKAMATQLGMMNPQFGEEGAIGYMRMNRGLGLGKGAGMGDVPTGGVDDETKNKAKRTIAELDETAKAISSHFGADGDITKDFKEFQKITTSMGNLSLMTEELARKFGALAGMSQLQIDKALKSGTIEAVRTEAGKKTSITF